MLMPGTMGISSSEFTFNNHYTSFNTLFASEVGSTLRTNTPCTRQRVKNQNSLYKNYFLLKLLGLSKGRRKERKRVVKITKLH
jgi:hypothetical protein